MQRLFKSSNKSQASLDRLTGSRDHSPTQQPDSTYPHAQAYSGPPSAAYIPPQYQQQQQQQQQPQQQQQQNHHQQLQQEHPPPESYYTEVTAQQHQAHILNRPQANRPAPGVGDTYAQDPQPTVKIVPPTNAALQQSQYITGQTQFGQSQTVRTDKEHKRSKRSLFGFSKREDKEEGNDRRSVGRVSSVLKKGGPHSPQAQQTSPKPPSSQYSDPRQAGLVENYSNENLPQDPEHYNQYREQQDPYRSQDQYDSPQSQHTRQSIQYLEDSRYQSQQPTQQSPHSQGQYNPIYQVPESPNTSETNLPYQGSRASASTYETNQALRPPSQTSLGPPSPLVTNPQHDSRPSTSNTQQQRYSAQSQQQQQQPQPQPQPPPGPPPQQQQQQQQQQHIEHPQPQHPYQQHSLPPSQQPTPQPTPQPQVVQQQSQAPQPPSHSQKPSAASNMPRNETTNGRRHDEQLYSQQDPRLRTQGHEQGTQGRSTPPPSRTREDLSNLDYNQLLGKYEELQAKYSKVKRYYFERDAQVTQLQNTVANQRLSMSKTSLDDAGYSNRFERLNGAIQNLSFNIRKDWRRVPNWLTPVCNRDAHNVGTKEMTAVGRACITRWLYESVFERVFHPGIDPNLSANLKSIERTLRRGHYSGALTNEQQDDILTKITTWRLTTVEGLQDILSSRQAEMYAEKLNMDLTKQLESYLRAFLNDPPPPGLFDNLSAILGQTINIIQNIPLESRDIYIEYFMPGSHVVDAYMRVESGMTILTQPGSALSGSDPVPTGNDSEDQSSTSSSQVDASQSMNVEEAIRESAKAASASGQSAVAQRNESIASGASGPPKLSQQNSVTSSSSKEKKGFLGGFVNKKSTSIPSSRSDHDQSKPNDGSSPDHGYTLQSLTGNTTDNKIRFAVFLAVEVRGRGVLRETGKDLEKVSGSSKDPDEKKDAAANANAAVNSSAGVGQQKSSSSTVGTNILCKAPVYVFE